MSDLADTLARAGGMLHALFGVSEERLKQETSLLGVAAAVQVPDLSVYYKVEAPDERLEELAEALRTHELVEAAYIKPPAELPQVLNDMAPAPEEAPPTTPDFSTRQGYLDAAPGGIDARYAWTQGGGAGGNVRIVDVEGAWRFTHEDLTQNQGGVVGGTQSTDPAWRNHGTAVVGEFGGDRNAFGITGICPDANVRAISIFGGAPGWGSAAAIRQAATMLNPGDIILIELHRPGPRFNFANRPDQRGFIPVEWWPDDFDAIRYATGRGVLVVEAGGNGAENVDDAIYNTPAAGFPATWTNPFNRANRDSGAIVVGAGAPPPGAHGRDYGPDRSRLDFSNYGAMIDAQGWGREVTSSGYGDLQGGASEDLWYTDRFSGTSSASPIIVGSLGCVQGVLRARGQAPLSPARARQCLRTTGSAQQDAPGRPRTQRIGNRPDLRQLIVCALGKTPQKELKDRVKDIKEKGEVKELKEKEGKELKEKEKEKEIKELKDHKDLKEKEHKELKEKEKDLKDLKEKEKEKEHKELKDGPKEVKEKDLKEKDLKDLKEKDKEIREGLWSPAEGAQPGSIEERVGRLEQTVHQLTHFIATGLRPDLTGAALGYEADAGGSGADAVSRELQKLAADAKQAKDNKDVEKLGER